MEGRGSKSDKGRGRAKEEGEQEKNLVFFSFYYFRRLDVL